MTYPVFILSGVVLAILNVWFIWRIMRAIKNKEKYRLFWLLPILAGLLPLAVFLLWAPTTIDPFGNSHEPDWLDRAISWGLPLIAGGLLVGTLVQNIRNHDVERNKWLAWSVVLLVVGWNGRGWMQEKVLWNHDLDTLLLLGGAFLWQIRASPRGNGW